ncbi:MAG: hypothetical protein LBT86_09075 [Deltaproteobacteria bacterium]|jgi:hypothetical protein|nr:hypothetical protein [Deltaproteobacteria bacterium]
MSKKNAQKNALDQKKNKKTQAKDLVRTIETLLADDNATEARSLYESISKLGRSPATDNQKAKAAFKLINWYADHDKLETALPLCQALARRSDNSEILMLQVEALTKMAAAFEAQGQAERARELRLSLWVSPNGELDPDDVPEDRAWSLHWIIFDLVTKNRLDEALKIFQTLNVADAPLMLEVGLAKLTADLLVSLRQKRHIEAAFAFFQVSVDLIKKHALITLAPTTSEMIISLAYSRQLDQAQQIYAVFENIHQTVYNHHLQAAIALIKALTKAGRLTEAINVCLKTPLGLKKEKRLEMEAIYQVLSLLNELANQDMADEAIKLWLDLENKHYAHYDYWRLEAQTRPQALIHVAQAVVGAYWRDRSPDATKLLEWLAQKTVTLFSEWDDSNLTLDHRNIFQANQVALRVMLLPAMENAKLATEAVIGALSPQTKDSNFDNNQLQEILGQAEAATYQLLQINNSGQELEVILDKFRNLGAFLADPANEPLWEKLIEAKIELGFLIKNGASFLIQAIKNLVKIDRRAEAWKLFDEISWLNLKLATGLSYPIQAAFALERPYAESDLPARPSVEESLPLYAATLELILFSHLHDDTTELETGLLSIDLESLKTALAWPLAIDLAQELERIGQSWLNKEEYLAAKRILTLISKLGDHPIFYYHYHALAIKFIKHEVELEQHSEALKYINNERDFILPQSREVTPGEPGPPTWLALAVLESVMEITYFYDAPIVKLPLDAFYKQLDNLSSARVYRLAFLSVISQAIEKAAILKPVLNPVLAHEPVAYYYGLLTSLEPSVLPPWEADWLIQLQNLANLSYPRYLLQNQRRAEAMEIYAQVEKNLPDKEDFNFKKALFIKDLSVNFAHSADFEESIDWLKQLLNKPPSAKIADLQIETATQVILSLALQKKLPLSEEVLGLLDENEPLTLFGRVMAMSYLFCEYFQTNDLDSAIRLYQRMRQTPITNSTLLIRLKTLANLVSEFSKIGETATATHLFLNRDVIDLTDLPDPTPEMERIHKLLSDQEPLPPLSESICNHSTISFSKELEWSKNNLAEKVTGLILECLNLEEEERAMKVYQSLIELNPPNPEPTNLAAKAIIENLIQKDRIAEAEAIVKARVETLRPPESTKFLIQCDKLTRRDNPPAS